MTKKKSIKDKTEDNTLLDSLLRQSGDLFFLFDTKKEVLLNASEAGKNAACISHVNFMKTAFSDLFSGLRAENLSLSDLPPLAKEIPAILKRSINEEISESVSVILSSEPVAYKNFSAVLVKAMRKVKAEENGNGRDHLRMIEVLMDASVDPIVLFDSEYNILALNKTASRWFRIDPKRSTGTNIIDLYPGVATPERKYFFDLALQTGVNISFEDEIDGALYNHNLYPVFNSGSKVESLALYSHDITERRFTEELLKIQYDIALTLSSSRDISEILSEMLERIICIDAIDCGVIYTFESIYGGMTLAAHRGLGEKFIGSIGSFPHNSPLVKLASKGNPVYSINEGRDKSLYSAYIEEGLRAFAFIPVKHEDKTIAVLALASHFQKWIPEKSKLALESIAMQIGGLIARIRVEQELVKSEKRYRAVVEDQTELICRVLPDGRITFVNEAYARYFGKASDFLIGRNCFSDIAEMSRSDVIEMAQSLTPDEPVGFFEHRARMPENRIVWQHWTTRALFNKQGKLVEYLATGRDITAGKMMEDELRKNEERLARALEATDEGLWDYNLETDMIYSSKRNFEILEFPFKSTMVPLSEVNRLMHPDDRKRVFDGFMSHMEKSNGSYDTEFRFMGGRKEFEWILTRAKVVQRDHDGRPLRVVGTNQLITDRKMAEEKLIISEKRLRSIIDNSTSIITLKDTGKRYILANRFFEKITGLSVSKIENKTDFELFPPYTAEGFSREDDRVLETGESIEFETVIHNRQDVRNLICTKFPLLDNSGKIYALGSILTDITELREGERELRRAKDAAEIANKAKSTFLANMSHEIRTPLNGISGMAQLLFNTKIDSKQKEFIEAIKMSSENLMFIINDILDLSKIEAEKAELVEGEFNLRAIIDNLVRIYRYQAERKNIDFKHTISSGIPEILCGDSGRLQQILNNLLSNAVKFTRMGRVEISAHLDHVRSEDHRAVIEFTVADTGIGISEDNISRIFRSFTQGDSSTSREYGGSGLGLAIARKLTEMMGGKISLKSRVGKGSRFVVSMPFKRAAGDLGYSGDPGNLIEPVSPGILSILVAEDNLINQKVIREMLSFHGHNVTIVSNGSLAVEEFSRGKFDCVFMDVQMPVLDGIETTKQIRKMEEGTGEHVPIIALTAAAIAGDRETFIEAGMDNYISKPIRLERLLDTLYSTIYGKTVSSEELGEEENSSLSGDIIDREKFLGMLDENTFDTYVEILDIFINEKDSYLATLRAAVDAGDARRIERESHRLKGIVSVFYSEENNEILKEIREMNESENFKDMPDVLRRLEYSVGKLWEELYRIRQELNKGK